MTSESGVGAGQSFCGNCGAVVEPGSRACGVCGHPVAETAGAMDAPPRDYIPYCRSCGVGVAWGTGHTCQRCGVAPLCALHFRAADGLCLDCANAPSYNAGGVVATGGLRCGACGAPVSPDADFCPNCGRAVALPQSAPSIPSAPYEGVEYMGFWIRAGAFLIDWIAAYLVAAILAAVIGISLTSGEVDPAAMDDITIALENINYSFLLMFWGLSVAHSVLLTGLRGQTLGKMLLRIQVVDANGNVPPWQRVAVREMARAVVLLALFPLGFIYIWVGFDARKRGPHDQLGGCYVVRKQRGARPPGGIF